jgi:hypothetical protein
MESGSAGIAFIGVMEIIRRMDKATRIHREVGTPLPGRLPVIREDGKLRRSANGGRKEEGVIITRNPNWERA